MAYDYDLVIVGDTPAGVAAAEHAARVKARVALVTTTRPFALQRAQVAHQGLVQLAQGRLPDSTFARVQRLGEELQPQETWTALLRLGVDVLLGRAEFESLNCLGVLPLVQKGRGTLGVPEPRRLKARRFLLTLPVVEGSVDPLFPQDLQPWTRWDRCPQRLVVLGQTFQGLELAIAFRQLGAAVTLILLPGGEGFMAQEDPEAAYLLLTQLETLGIRVLTAPEMPGVERPREGLVRVDLEGEVIEADRLLLALPHCPNLEPLRLERAGVVDPLMLMQAADPHQRLHQSNSRLYWCDGQEGGVSPRVQQALWGSWWQADPVLEVQGVQAPCSWVRVRRRTWHRSKVESEPLVAQLNLPLVSWFDPSQVNRLKVWVTREGRIVEAWGLGQTAVEAMGTIALAMKENQRLSAFEGLPVQSIGATQLLQKLNQQRRWQRLAQNPWWEDRMERFFNFRRTGNV